VGRGSPGVAGRAGARPAAAYGALVRGADAALSVLLVLWAVLSLLPVGVAAGVADLAYYAETWRFWAVTLVLAVLVAALLLVATRGAVGRWFRRALGAALAVPAPAFLAVTGGLAAAEAAAVSWWCFARNPQAIDGWVQFFQARIFLAGRLVAPPPPSVAHFGTLHMLITDRGWFSHFPPLHPALLAVGMAAGAAWLVTPLATGLLPAAVFALGRRTGDERVARLAAVLSLVSPFVIGMGASAMNHVPAALAIALGLWTLPAVAAGGAGPAFALGVAAGIGLGIRPLDATALAALGGATLLATLSPRSWTAVGATLLGGLVAAAPTFLFNAATTGHPLRFAYSELWGPGLDLGFHATPWGDALTPARALGLTAVDAHQMNVYLLEWPLPVTALVAVALWRRRGRLGGLRAPAAYVVALVAGLFLYFHRDTLYGPRLLFSIVPALFVLLAAAMVDLGTVPARLGWRGVTVGDAVTTALVVVALLSAGLLVPKRIASFSTAGTSVALHPDRDAAAAGIRHAVVVMREGWGPRLIARMWALGVPMRESSRLYRAFDACALERRLGEAERAGVRGPALLARLAADAASADPGVVAPDVVPDRMIRLPRDHRLAPACVEEIERDREGTMQFPAFLHLNAPALDGEVVWARDMGAANAALRRLYPDRPLYRYRWSPTTGRATFEPLS